MWLQGQRFGTVGCEKAGVTHGDHHLPRRRLPAREPQARGHLRRLDRGRPRAARLHGQRHGARAARAAPRRPVRRRGRPGRAALRTPQAPEVSFGDDPLRMLRAARFVAAFGLVPAPELVEAIAAMRHRLEIVSIERIRDELSRLLVVDDPAPGLWLLCETGLVRRVPARAQRDAARAGPDPHAQGRARAHDRGRRQHAARAAGAARRAAARRRQAEDALDSAPAA